MEKRSAWKRLLSMLAVFVLAVFCMSLADFSGSGKTEAASRDFKIKNGVLLDYYGDDTDVVVPDGVTKIGRHAFTSEDNIYSVELPKSVTVIEDEAFTHCILLQDVRFSANLKKIGNKAFYGCVDLYYISKLPQTLTSIGDRAFYDCMSLRSINIPSGVTRIGDKTFYQCFSLEKISLSKNLKGIGEGAFCECWDLQSIKLPDGLKSIGANAFNNCKSLETIFFPKSLSHIGEAAFDDVPWLDNAREEREDGLVIINNILLEGLFAEFDVIIPEQVDTIVKGAFLGNSSITSIQIPSGVTILEDGFLSGCYSLEKVVLPDKLEIIGDEAFFECMLLEEIEIPNTVVYVGRHAFEETMWLDNQRKSNALVEVNHVLIDGKTAAGDVILPDDIVEISAGAFSHNAKIKSIRIPETIEYLGDDIFEDCPDITIIGVAGSEAHRYANAYKIPFKVKDGKKIDISKCKITLRTSAYTYNGKAVKPAVSVKYGNITLINNTDYTVLYSNNVNAGTATATIKGKGICSAEVKKTFKINKATQTIKYTKSYTKPYGSKAFTVYAKRTEGNGKLTYSSSNKKIATVNAKGKVSIKNTGYAVITVKAAATANYNAKSIKIAVKVSPKKAAVSSVRVGKRKLTAKWKKDGRASGYQLQYSTYGNFKKGVKTINISKNSTVSKTLTKLTRGRRYYVRVRAYKTVKINGKSTKLYGAFSNAKKSGKIK